ncbi:uncharacterized protein ACBT57_007133 isoform 2-T2 [Dama dama]
MRRLAEGKSAPREGAQRVRRRRAGAKKGGRRAGTKGGRGSLAAAAGGAIRGGEGCDAPAEPHAGFCSREGLKAAAISKLYLQPPDVKSQLTGKNADAWKG